MSAPADPPFPTGAAPPPVRRAVRQVESAAPPFPAAAAVAGAPAAPAAPVAARGPANISPPEAPSAWWKQALPAGALVGGMSLLGLSTMLAFRMSFKKQVKDEAARAAAEGGKPAIPLHLSEAEARRKMLTQALPGAGGATVGNIAAKAFLYGTAWCVGGCAALIGGSCWYLDAWDAPTFASRMQDRMPNMRVLFEDTLAPLASSVQAYIPDVLKPRPGKPDEEAKDSGSGGAQMSAQDAEDMAAFISFLSEAAGVTKPPSASSASSPPAPSRPLSRHGGRQLVLSDVTVTPHTLTASLSASLFVFTSLVVAAFSSLWSALTRVAHVSSRPAGAARRTVPRAPVAALAAACFALTTAPVTAIPPPRHGHLLGSVGDYSGWDLIWEDDFTTPANALNTTWWSPRVNETHCQPCELQLYMPDALTVDNGTLTITTSRAHELGPGGQLFNFTSGWVDTQNKLSWRYGRFEVRAQLPSAAAAGTWPAHWLLPASDQCWPMGGEVDIMENTRMPVVGDVIFGSYRWGTACGNNRQVLPGAAYPPLGAPAVNWTDWHVFGVEWNATALSFYVDGNYYETKTADQVSLPTAPMYFILNTAVAWYWPPGPDAAYPATHVIDWVRVWQQANATSGA